MCWIEQPIFSIVDKALYTEPLKSADVDVHLSQWINPEELRINENKW